MTRVVVIVAVLAAACTDDRRSQPSPAECEQYAAAMSREVELRYPDVAEKMRSDLLQQCRDGEISYREVDCMIAFSKGARVTCTVDRARSHGR